MPRMTRAKAHEVAEQLHIDEDAVLDLPLDSNGGVDIIARKTPAPGERNPLAELAPNSSGGNSAEEDQMTDFRKSRRERKGKKSKSEERESVSVNGDEIGSQPIAERSDGTGEVGADEQEVVSMPARVEAGETVAPEKIEGKTLEPETLQASDAIAEQPTGIAESEPTHESSETSVNLRNLVTQVDIDPPTSPLPCAMPTVIQQLRRDTPAKRSTSNKENVEPSMDTTTPLPNASRTGTPRPAGAYDALEDAVVRAVTPSTAGTSRQPLMSEDATSVQPKEPISPSRSHDSIAALDALDDAVEAVTAQVPDVQASPTKPKPQPDTTNPATTKLQPRKAAPIVRPTKASQARISLAHPTAETGGNQLKTLGLGRPRPSSMYGGRTSLLLPSAGNNDARSKPKEAAAVEIPHSKPRPVSLSFPTPPPPPKSRKPPTKSTFQLPGEAVAAKLKAAREERTKREEQEGKESGAAVKNTAKPRPASLSVPKPPPPSKSRKPPTKSTFQLPGDAVAARLKAAREERMKVEPAAAISKNDKIDGSNNAKRPAFKARPVPATMTKPNGPAVRQTSTSKARESLMAAKPAPAPPTATSAVSGKIANKKRTSTIAPSSRPSAKTPSISTSTTTTTTTGTRNPADRLSVAKRPSITSTTSAAQQANSSAPRASLSAKPPTTTTTAKGREVFSRPALAASAAAEEKKGKEEAARKARMMAAERGRVASREWAEKKKKMRAEGKEGSKAGVRDGEVMKGEEAEVIKKEGHEG